MIPFIGVPREMGYPKREGMRIVHNRKEFLEAVNLNNGKKTVFTSIFAFMKLLLDKFKNEIPDYETAIIDKLFFDFDCDGKTDDELIDNVKKIHNYLIEKDLKHVLIFSGGGFHVYVKIKITNIKYKKDALFNGTTKILDDAKLSYGDSKECDADRAVLGKIDQLARVPNTFNIKRGRFCIYLNEDDLLRGMDFIKEKATPSLTYPKNNSKPKVYGTKEVDLSEYDFPSKKSMIKTFNKCKVIINDNNINDEFLKILPACMRYVLTNRTNHKYWYWLVVHLRDIGFVEEENKMICKKYLSKYKRTDGTPNDYQHMKIHDHIFQTVYHKGTHFFPNCETLLMEGLCPNSKTCKWKGKMYYEK